MSGSLIDIIIASYGEAGEHPPAYLKRCLNTVNAFTRSPYRIILQQSLNSAAWNRNRGIERSSAPYICFLDDDAWVTPGWCEVLLHPLLQNKNLGMTGPRIKLENGRIFCLGISFQPPDLFLPVAQNMLDEDLHNNFDIYPFALPTTCLMLRREILEEAGHFDEGFESCQWEDLDFYLRLRCTGYKGLLNTDAVIYHRNLFRSFHYGKNQFRFMNRWHKFLNQSDNKESSFA